MKYSLKRLFAFDMKLNANDLPFFMQFFIFNKYACFLFVLVLFFLVFFIACHWFFWLSNTIVYFLNHIHHKASL